MKKILLLSLPFALLLNATDGYASDQNKPEANGGAAENKGESDPKKDPPLKDEDKNNLKNTNPAVTEDDPLAPFNKEQGFSGSFTNIKYRCTAYPETEQKKFLDLTLSAVLKLLKKGQGWEQIRGTAIPYSTGSKEGAADFYDGYLIITDLRYGFAYHKFISVQQGFDPVVSVTSKREEIDAHTFLNHIAKKDGKQLQFHKGTPDKDEYTNTRMEYVLYNNKSTREVRVTAIRKEKQEYLKTMKEWRNSKTLSQPLEEKIEAK